MNWAWRSVLPAMPSTEERAVVFRVQASEQDRFSHSKSRVFFPFFTVFPVNLKRFAGAWSGDGG
ncbi:MAG: hypothetical protein D6743_15080 [Calditrichaeota bacterium]|nr:MAG: hypothetical protein D6743_15080 [Calditrichota bacterium]